METKTDITTDWSKKLPSQILFEAANTLEEGDRWIKGRLFGQRNNQVCFCAHGAIQYCGREPKVKQQIERLAMIGEGSVAISDATWIQSSLFQAYRERYGNPRSVSFVYYHLFLAHCFAHTVGCDFSFNDFKAQNKEEVIAKLREAAAFALEHQHEYLDSSST